LTTPPAFDPAIIDTLMQSAQNYQMEIVLAEKK
jgi:hypothetical protein